MTPRNSRALAVSMLTVSLLSMVGCAAETDVDTALLANAVALPTATTTATTTTTTTTTTTSLMPEFVLGIAAAGNVTDLPAVGAVVAAGQPLLEVDGAPVGIVMQAATTETLERTLELGAADGDDIEIVERNLVDLGYATADEVAVDGHWTEATTAAVADLQESLGSTSTGRLEPGDVVFVDADVTITSQLATIGEPASGHVLAASTSTSDVIVQVRS